MKWRQRAVRIWAYTSLLLIVAIIVFMFAYIFAIGSKNVGKHEDDYCYDQ